MTSWTSERHAEAREWCKGRGSLRKDFTAALDEIERLQEENAVLHTVSQDIADAIGVSFGSPYRNLLIQDALKEMKVILKIEFPEIVKDKT